MAAYEVETTFYCADDPVVRAARAAQNGRRPAAGAIEAALAENANRGEYGRAVALALCRLRDASAYWERRTDELPKVQQ